MARVAPSERFRAELDEALVGVGQEQDPVEAIGRLGARLILQQALEDEVSEFLGRRRYERAERKGRAAGRAAVLHHRRPTHGRPWSAAAVRTEFRRLAARAGVRRRFAPHQLRHAHALELAREGVARNIIQRQLGHANLGATSIYLQGIDPEEIITAVRTRRGPVMSASAGLRL